MKKALNSVFEEIYLWMFAGSLINYNLIMYKYQFAFKFLSPSFI